MTMNAPLIESRYEALLGVDQAVLDAIPAAVYVCDAAGAIVRFNRAAAELWGRTPNVGDSDERFCGSFRLYRMDGTRLPHAETPMEAVLRTGAPRKDKEVVVERPDGSRIIVLANLEPLTGADGAMQGAVNCFQDVTDRRLAEEENRAERAELENFFENAGVAMCWIDGSGVIRRANRAELELLGYDREDYVGRRMSEFHMDRATGEEVAARLSGGEQLHRFPAHLRTRAGEIKPVFISSTAPSRNAGNSYTQCITLERSAEQVRQELAAIVKSSQDAIVSKDLNGVIVSWNRGAERLFGYGADEAIGQPITMLIPPDQHDEEPTILQRIRRGERVDTYETLRRRKDGETIDISLTVSPVRDADGRIVGASKIARDISERKQAKEQRSLLMRELSHRSKNLLAMVQGLMQQAARHAVDRETFVEDFGDRLKGLARSHDLLVDQAWKGAALSSLAHAHLGFIDDSEAVTTEGPDLLLAPAAAQTLGLALYELATNAVKHGALSVTQGRVHLDWAVQGEGEGALLLLRWRETGGPSVRPPRRQGFGTVMVERIAPQALQGSATLAFEPGGVSWTLEVAVEHLRADASTAP